MSKNTNLSFLTDYITADITNGRIGINNASPAYAFDVTGVAKFSSSVTAADLIISDTYANDPLIKLATTTSGSVEVQMRTATTTYNAGIGVVTSGYDFGLFTNNTTRMTITSAGTILINATSSTYGAASGYNLGVKGTSSQGFISIARTGQSLDSQGMIIGLDTATAYFSVIDNIPLSFATNNAERMRITSGGNVGIGTSSPAQKLEVIGTTKLSSAAGNATGINIIPGSVTNTYQTIGESNSGTVRFHAGIVTGWAAWENWGASYMDFKVEIKGSGTSDTSYTAMQIRPTGDIRMYSLVGSGTRTVVADGNGQLSAPVSDITLKENIETIGYGIKEIMKMNPIWFEFKDGYKNYGETRQNGNIAQEMAEIIPEAVFTTPQTGKMGINYEQLHAVYIKAIQELKAEIETLKNK